MTDHPSAPSPEHPPSGRRADGRFIDGNAHALRHGGYSRQVREALRPEQAEARAAIAEARAAIENDLGGAESLSALTRDLVGRYVTLTLIAEFLGHQLATVGPLTGKGRQRAALTAYLAVIDRLNRLALSLGLERKAKRVDTIADIVREHAEPK